MSEPSDTPADGAPSAEFRDLAALVAEHARRRPEAIALRSCPADGEETAWTWAELDAVADRVAAALHRDGAVPGRSTLALCGASNNAYLGLFIGALRAGAAATPLAPGSTPAQLAAMVADCGTQHLFIDASVADAGVTWPASVQVWRLDEDTGERSWRRWLAAEGTRAPALRIDPTWPFNLIYSSGTTGTPKGIVQAHQMRWGHIQRAVMSGYGEDTVTLTSTPLYSNTTLVSVIPTLAHGGTVVLMPKFDAARYLQLAHTHRPTHTMLVPVQYQRLMARPDFDAFDLSSFRYKFCTSAPFHAALKADVLKRWPGGLVEYYGMTEGGGTCILQAHLHPTKLHTVGQPAEGHDIRLIDEHGVELPRVGDGPAGYGGASGEVVGRSGAMMTGYHQQPALTAAAEWYDAEGRRYIRTGDIGRFDEDGFLILFDRRKDMIISGGFNIYPSDLEAVLRQHPAVADVAVFGLPSAEWGETPAACAVRRSGDTTDAEAVRAWANAQLGKTQRISALHWVDELPRNAIGKVLKRELREQWARR